MVSLFFYAVFYTMLFWSFISVGDGDVVVSLFSTLKEIKYPFGFLDISFTSVLFLHLFSYNILDNLVTIRYFILIEEVKLHDLFHIWKNQFLSDFSKFRSKNWMASNVANLKYDCIVFSRLAVRTKQLVRPSGFIYNNI